MPLFDAGCLGEETTFHLLSHEEVEEHGLRAVALGNEDTASTTILECTHGPDGQIFIPGIIETVVLLY